MTDNYKNPFDFFDYQKFLTAVKLPGVGSNDKAVASSKKTLEAYSGASKAIYEGFNTFAKKQVEILNSAIANAKDASTDFLLETQKMLLQNQLNLLKSQLKMHKLMFLI